MFPLKDIWEVMVEEIACRRKRQIPLADRVIPMKGVFGAQKWDGFSLCELSTHRTERADGNKMNLCPCGCGYMVRNGWESIEGHGLGKGKLKICRYMPQRERVFRWVFANGFIPDDYLLSQSCKVPYCDNPKHALLVRRKK